MVPRISVCGTLTLALNWLSQSLRFFLEKEYIDDGDQTDTDQDEGCDHGPIHNGLLDNPDAYWDCEEERNRVN